MALIAIGILGAISMAVLSLFNTFNAQSKHFNSVVGARALMSTMQGFIAYRQLCFQNLDPSTRTFNLSLATTPDGMPLSLRLGGGSTGAKVEAGSVLRNYDVEVDYLSYRNAAFSQMDPQTPTNRLYSGELVLKLKKSGAPNAVAGGNELRERTVGTMVVSVNPVTSQITDCYALMDVRKACEEVGGTYDDTKDPKCQLRYPCEGQLNAMFMGYDANGVAQCRTMAQIVGSTCTVSGQFLVSDGAGGMTCKSP